MAKRPSLRGILPVIILLSCGKTVVNSLLQFRKTLSRKAFCIYSDLRCEKVKSFCENISNATGPLSKCGLRFTFGGIRRSKTAPAGYAAGADGLIEYLRSKADAVQFR